MVCWSVYHCVAAYTCERNSMQKHLYLFRIEPIKRYLTICGGLHLCISVCGCGYLSTEHNEETIGTLAHLSQQVMSVNMWYWDCLSFSSIGSSGRVGGAKKHEIYVAAFGSHLFYDLFLQGWGGAMAPSAPPLDPLLFSVWIHIPVLFWFMLQVTFIFKTVDRRHNKVPENKQWRKPIRYLPQIHQLCVNALFSHLMLQVIFCGPWQDWHHKWKTPHMQRRKPFLLFSSVNRSIQPIFLDCR